MECKLPIRSLHGDNLPVSSLTPLAEKMVGVILTSALAIHFKMPVSTVYTIMILVLQSSHRPMSTTTIIMEMKMFHPLVMKVLALTEIRRRFLKEYQFVNMKPVNIPNLPD